MRRAASRRTYHQHVDQRPGLPDRQVAGIPVYLAPSWFVIAPARRRGVRAPGRGVGEPAAAADLPGGRRVRGDPAGVRARARVRARADRPRGRAPGAGDRRRPVGRAHPFTEQAPDPGRGALVAVVGPVSNGVLAALGWLALPAADGDVVRLLLVAGIYANAVRRRVQPAARTAAGRRTAGRVGGLGGEPASAGPASWWPAGAGGWSPSSWSLWFVVRPLRAGRPADGVRPGLVGHGRRTALARRVRRGRGRPGVPGGRPARPGPLPRARRARSPVDHGLAEPEPATPSRWTSRATRWACCARRTPASWSPPPQPPGPQHPAVGGDDRAALGGRRPGRPRRRGRRCSALSTQGAHLLIAVDDAGRVVGIADSRQLAQALTGRP